MMTGFEIKKPKRHFDDRGFLQELGRGEFRQVNWSSSKAGVLRGLHYAPYSKLVTCIRGRVFDVAVDCRLDTPTYGAVSVALLDQGGVDQVLIPEQHAHGFLALVDSDVVYLQSQEWHDNEITIHYADPTLSVGWPTNQLKAFLNISSKDHGGLSWKDFTWLLNDLRAMKSVH